MSIVETLRQTGQDSEEFLSGVVERMGQSVEDAGAALKKGEYVKAFMNAVQIIPVVAVSAEVASNQSDKDPSELLDRLPPGADEGIMTIAASAQATVLAGAISSGVDLNHPEMDQMIENLAKMGQKLEEYQQREDAPNETVLEAIGDKVEGVLQVVSENVVAGAAGAAFGTLGGVPGVAATSTVLAAQTFGTSLLQEFKHSGVDITDKQALKEAFSNEELLQEAVENAGIKAGLTGAAALTAGVAVLKGISVVKELTTRANVELLGDLAGGFSKEFTDDIIRAGVNAKPNAVSGFVQKGLVKGGQKVSIKAGHIVAGTGGAVTGAQASEKDAEAKEQALNVEEDMGEWVQQELEDSSYGLQDMIANKEDGSVQMNSDCQNATYSSTQEAVAPAIKSTVSIDLG